MEAMFNFIPAPIALVLMFIGFAALAVGAIRLGYKQYVKQWALELVTIAEDSIMGSGQGAKKKAQVFAALRGALPDWLKPFITDEVLDSVIEKAVSMMKKAMMLENAMPTRVSPRIRLKLPLACSGASIRDCAPG